VHFVAGLDVRNAVGTVAAVTAAVDDQRGQGHASTSSHGSKSRFAT
jgi:hypothetical protein